MNIIGRKVRKLFKSSLFLFISAVLFFSTVTPLARVFADSPDPVLPIPQGTVVHNADGTTTVTMSGQWQWTTHHSDCNLDKYGVGWAIDWHDLSMWPNSQPGNTITGQDAQHNTITAHVGTPTDNNVHYTHLQGEANPLGDPVGATRCGTYNAGLDYNTGDWGPISHTYPAGALISACVVTYDIHKDNKTADGIKAGDLIAGGNGHNGDNSVESNGNTPAGNGCFSPPPPAPNLTLAKHVTNDNGGSANASAWTLSATGSGGFSGNGSPATGADASISQDVTAGVQYTLSEASGPTGYSSTGIWNCVGGGTFVSPNKITMASGQNETCTITNDDIAPTLTLTKTVINDNGGNKTANDFQAKIDGTNTTWSTAVPLSAGSHTASEVNLPGYAAGSWGGDCAADGSITLTPGENATCTITNDDSAPSLTLNKILSNTHGGTAPESAWTLHANGASQSPTNLSGPGAAGNADVVSGSNFKADTYTLSETGGPNGYSASNWTCTNNVTVTNSQITLTNGQTTVCTITNSDIAPTITLQKTVINNHGGTKTVSDFQAQIDNLNAGWFTPIQVNAGGHTASEGAAAGYKASVWGGDCNPDGTLTLTLSQNAICTITNEDIAPTLTVVKGVVNNNGGSATADDFTLKVNGSTLTNGVLSNSDLTDTYTYSNAQAGTAYTVSEDSPTSMGYAQDSLVCADNDTHATLNNPVTLSLAQNVTCTITNNDIAPTLKLIKYVSNNYSGTKTPHDWTLTATGTSGFSDSGDSTTFHSVNAGVAYNLSESNIPGYATNGWWCDDGNQSGNTITLSAGQNVTCYITNYDIPVPAIHVVKSGPATAEPGQTVTYTFTVTNTGDLPLSAVTVNDDIAGVGTYISGDDNGNKMLDLKEAWTYTANYKIPTNQNVSITNTVTACGESNVLEDNDRVQSLSISNHSVCDTDSHTTNIPVVLGTSIVKPKLVNTGQSATDAIYAGVALLLATLGAYWVPECRKK